ncbi:cell adhesion molecule Dscam2-like [Bacillus rossius redtenbacheri]|uniref:cell adhesion molecule Dscam2-like n=1 Tax=Bacillus rossius redtenbacheri TaxID=93214 RepID=UPI002FDE3458
MTEVLANGSLHFPPFSAEQFSPEVHVASYRCRAANPAGAVVSRDCRVRAHVLQPYEVQVNNAYVMKGNVAVLRCGISGFVRDVVTAASWLKEDPQTGRTTLHPGSRFSMTSSGALHVHDTVPSDAYSHFYCWTLHRLTGERRLSRPGQIIVTEPERDIAPRIEHSVSSVSVRAGSTADLVCVAQGNPPPKYRWYREVSGSLQEVHPSSVLVWPLQSVLQFPRAQPEDSARYVCAASSALGEDRREMSLAVRAPLSAQVRPQLQVADVGSSASFSCLASVAGLQLAWLRNGRPLAEDERVSVLRGAQTLVIHSVRKEDKGVYQCVVQGDDDSAQASGELGLGAVAPELLSTFIEQTLQPGPPVSLRCIAAGNPPPHVTWLLDGGQLSPRGYVLGSFVNPAGSVVSHLNISYTRVQHGGIYSCVARNLLGTARHSAALNVYGPPTARQPVNITAVVGTDLYVVCPAAGYPVSRHQWERAGALLPAHRRHTVFANGTLLIRRVDGASDKGEYLCSVSNQQGQTALGRVHLDIMKPPEIAPFQFPGKLSEGMRAQVSCSIISGDFPIFISWRKDGGSLPQDPAVLEQRHQFVSSLMFGDLAARHSGRYTCIAGNAAATTNYTARLEVRVPPAWVIEPHNASVLFQHSISLHCHASGHPTPSITWLKGTVPARFVSRAANHSGVLGHSAVLECEAEGDPPLRITWSTARHPGPLGRGQVTERPTASGLVSQLHLGHLEREHAGAYHCLAANNFGQDQMVVYLTVKEPPDVPEQVQVVAAGSRWLSVSWDTPRSGQAPVQHYVAQFRVAEGGPWSNVTVDRHTLTTRLGGLQPSSAYFIRVLAVNEVGASEPSTPITGLTTQEAPSAPPSDVFIKATSSTSVNVQWKPPAGGQQQGALAGYRISYRQLPSGATQVRTVKGGRSEVLLTSLRQYSRYEVTVQAFNSVGPGPASPPLVVTTLEGVPGAPPQNVRCQTLSSQSLRLQWEPPDPDHRNGVIEGYKVTYRRASPRAGQQAAETKKTSSLETTLHGLARFTNYSARVAAFTRAGEGSRSSPLLCRTDQDVPGPPDMVKALTMNADSELVSWRVPGPPDMVKALAMNADSVLVSWRGPREPNGDVVKYHVFSRSLLDGKETQDSVPADKDLLHEARRLKEFQRYEFWVTAVTVVGEGPSSARVTQSPVSRVPARIASFSGAVFGAAGRALTLPCRAVGLPAPSRTWRGPGGGGALLPRHQLLPDRRLSLSPLAPDHAGNYTCVAENVFGRDEVTYALAVQVPPRAPVLSAAAASPHGLTLVWRAPDSGGSPITGFILKYKHSLDQWQKLFIDPDDSSFTLDGLKCGVTYHLSLLATNEVGHGKPSPVITAATKGAAPKPLAQEDFQAVNQTSVVAYMPKPPAQEDFLAMNQTSMDAYTPKPPAQEDFLAMNQTSMVAYTPKPPAQEDFLAMNQTSMVAYTPKPSAQEDFLAMNQTSMVAYTPKPPAQEDFLAMNQTSMVAYTPKPSAQEDFLAMNQTSMVAYTPKPPAQEDFLAMNQTSMVAYSNSLAPRAPVKEDLLLI